MNNYNNILERLAEIKSMGNLQGMYSSMMNNNPQFRRFVEMNKGKSPEQIARENGIDINLLMKLIR